MKIEIFDTPDALGDHLAARLLVLIGKAEEAGRQFLLGCPTGRSPLPTYRALARHLTARPQTLGHLVLVMMDEYLVEGEARLVLASPRSHYSCQGFAAREIVEPISRALPAEFRLAPENVWFPDPDDPAAIERRIAEAGGIDFFILASGAGDGHVAFNPPDSSRESRTRVIPLSEQTRRDNMETFPGFRALNEVPRHGVSLGIGTIAEARAAAMILTGEGKREAFARTTKATRYDPKWPATIVAEILDAMVLADNAAAHPIVDTA